MRGQCTRPRLKAGQLCQANADCDSAPGSGDGLCKGRLRGLRATAVHDQRLHVFRRSITVPLRQTTRGFGSGTKTLKLTASPSNDPVTGKKRPKDTDSLKLVCKPGL